MSLIRYRPFPVATLQEQIDRMFDEFDRHFNASDSLGGGTFAPAMDVKESADAYTVQIEVPGMAQNAIQIGLHDNVLTLRGSKEHRAESQNKGEYRRVERSYGSFARSVTLPRPVDGAQVSASLEDGVLTVVLPKLEAAKPRQIAIGVGNTGGVAASGHTFTAETHNPQTPSEQTPSEGDGVVSPDNPTPGTQPQTEPAPTNPAESNPQDPEPTGEPGSVPS